VSISGAGARRELSRLRADFRTESAALVRRGLWVLAGKLTPVLAVDHDGFRLFVSTADQHLGRRLFCYPTVSERDIEQAFEVLETIAASRGPVAGRTVVEIGASVGNHTVELVKRYGARGVVAIEPDPDNCTLLRQNLLANNASDQVSLLQVALSDQDGVVELERSPTNSGGHEVLVADAALANGRDRLDTISVPAARFDSLVASGDLDLSSTALVWMDAQGHEGHILRGAKQLLASDVPIVTEYWPEGLRRAGGLDEFHEIVASNYSYVIDLNTRGEGNTRLVPADRLEALERDYGWDRPGDHVDPATDIVLSRAVDESWGPADGGGLTRAAG
jgi:FkbM family methyltransferase